MRLLLSFVALMVFMTSCATTRDHVSIQYEPLQGTEKVANAEKVALSVQVNDHRASKERVGRKMSGSGIDCASILTENDVSVVVKDAISQELQNRGFVVSSDNPASVLVDVDLLKFYNAFRPGYFTSKAFSEVVLNVKVIKNDKTLTFSRALIGTAINKDVAIHSGNNTKIALEDALRNTLSELMNDSRFIEALIQSDKQVAAAL